MNEQDIDNLTGRELDLAIAKYIFGQESPMDDIDLVEDGYVCEKLSDGQWRCEKYNPTIRSTTVIFWPELYHEQDFLAFWASDKVLEGNKDMRFMASFLYGEKWVIVYCNGKRLCFAKDESRPIAICRAALKVVNNE